MGKTFLVLDKEEYRTHENEYNDLLSMHYPDSKTYFMEYETLGVRKCKNIPLIGKALHHIGYWYIAARNALKLYRKKPDLIFCVNSLVAIFLGILNSKKHCIKLISYGFLFEPKKNKFYYNLRKTIANKAIGGIDKIGVATKKEVDTYGRIFNNNEKFVFIPYGADYDIEALELRPEYLKPKQYIISTGVSNRDYPTLINAYHKLVNEGHDVSPLCIMTAPYCLSSMNLENIVTIYESRLSAIKALVRDAKYIVMSLKEGDVGVGHTILLLSLRENTPIIVNRIPSIEDYVTDKEVCFFESGNVQELADKILEMEKKHELKVNTRKYYEENYTEIKFVERLLACSINGEK